MPVSARKIIFVTDKSSWANPYVEELIGRLRNEGHEVRWSHSHEEVDGEDIAFYLSYMRITPPDALARSRHNIVVHASDLPKGKGFSPLTWQILEGKDDIVLSMIEAAEKVDSGPVYLKETVHYQGTELVHELRDPLGQKIVQMCMRFVHEEDSLVKNMWVQEGEESFYPRRRAVDSQLDPNRTIVEQFNILRVVDNDRYPAFFEYKGRRYLLKIEPDTREKV